MQSTADDNPYTWDVDLTMVTLANFNYRTLSLVRDYDSLLTEPMPNAAFDELFSTAPRDVAEHGRGIPVADRYLVVPADASQVGAVALARSGDNFVIQGPPGTGKSQTITNLVADFVAHGKRVLFVCQKRAALDVVHARLRAQGLGEICTLVHDSQQDKKEFVHGLRDTYERWLADDEPLDAVEARRAALIEATTAALAEVGAYEQALAGVQDVLDRLIALRGFRWGDDLTPAEQALLPEPADWVPARPLVDALVVRAGPRGCRSRCSRARRSGWSTPRSSTSRAPTRSSRSALPRRRRRSTRCSPCSSRRPTATGSRSTTPTRSARCTRCSPRWSSATSARRSPRAPRPRAGCRTRRSRGARSRRPRTRPTEPRWAGASRCPRPTRRRPSTSRAAASRRCGSSSTAAGGA